MVTGSAVPAGTAPDNAGWVPAGYELRVLILLGLAFGFAYFDRMALTFLAPFVQADLGLSNEEIGWANSGLSLTWALGAYLVGRWSDLIGRRKPFLIGGGLMIVIGIIPQLSGLLATMPITVGNAVLFVAYLQLLGTTLKGLREYAFDSVTIHRLAVPVLIGLCIMNLDARVFGSLPVLLQPLLSNGFIMGILIAIMIDKLVKWDAP